MDSNDAIAESYLRQQELDGDPYGEKFNGGVDLIPVSSISSQNPYRTDFDAADPVGGRDDGPDSGMQSKVVTTNPVPDADGVYRQKIDWGRLHADEDPLFKRIAGDSNEFVGGIPRQVWDGLSQEQKDRFTKPSEGFAMGARVTGAALGAAIGTPIGAGTAAVMSGGDPTLTTIGGWAGSGAGGQLGSEMVNNWLNKQPSIGSRAELHSAYKWSKEHD